MQREEQGHQIGAMIRVQVRHEDKADVIDAPGSLPGLDQAHQGPRPGIHQNGLAAPRMWNLIMDIKE